MNTRHTHVIGNIADPPATLPIRSLCATLALAMLVACNDDSLAPADASSDGTLDSNTPDGGVDPTKGVFVDATSGNDSNAGTESAPMRTIGAALAKTDAQHTYVFVCEGTYAEDLVLDASHDGVSIYGGWKCSDWSYTGNLPIIGKTQTAAKLDSLTKPITIADVEIDSLDGDGTNTSSTAMFVNACTNVTLSRVKLSAGSGHDGISGTVATYTYPTQTQLNGNAADAGTGGAAKTFTCPNGQMTTGGKGGDNGFNGDPGAPSLDGGAGGTVVNCINSTQGGGKGESASDQSSAPQIANVGTITASGWSGASGVNGMDGPPGQGGGGGAGTGGGGGGGGGCGGCGGAGGGGGVAGGASIALAVLSSTVIMNSSALVAKAAGAGGAGVAGQPGETLFGFFGGSTPPGCTGGNGGTGGAGGSGAGGAGGVSIGLVWRGSTAPTLDGNTQSNITFGTKGTKGTGGSAGVNDGIDGIAQAIYQVP